MQLKHIDLSKEEIVSPKKTARLLGISRSKLDSLRKESIIPYVKLPGEDYRIVFLKRHCEMLINTFRLDVSAHENPYRPRRKREKPIILHCKNLDDYFEDEYLAGP